MNNDSQQVLNLGINHIAKNVRHIALKSGIRTPVRRGKYAVPEIKFVFLEETWIRDNYKYDEMDEGETTYLGFLEHLAVSGQ